MRVEAKLNAPLNKPIVKAGIASRVRNTSRWLINGRKPIKTERVGNFLRVGHPQKLLDDLEGKLTPFIAYHNKTSKPSKTINPRTIASTVTSSRIGADNNSSFNGSGFDEHFPTRLLRDYNELHGQSNEALKNAFNARSRTSALIWKNEDDTLAGHTPAIKTQQSGRTGAVTSEHNIRDNLREAAIDTTFNDKTSPESLNDAVNMGTLATIKYMSSPQIELEKTRQKTVNGNDLFSTMTQRKINNTAGFNDMLEHAQEVRERMKWEVGASMLSKEHLHNLVPPTMKNYLSSHGNNPTHARENFRHDIHNNFSIFKPNVNTAEKSNTDDLRTSSLKDMANKTLPTGGRKRALSDARMLPRQIPRNARGDT